MRVLKNYIGGQWIESTSRSLRQSFNPANREELVCNIQDSNPADAVAAIQAAENAYAAWAQTPAPKRAALLQDFLSHFRSREEEFVRAITRENGKTLRESRTEFVAALKEADFQVGQGRRVAGQLRPAELSGVSCYLQREPLGVVTLITPWNFPLNVACRKLIPALIAGNTCVLKPAELTPMSAALLFESFHAAGLPPGVVNLVFGRGSVIGETLVTHPAVKALSFTGSTEVGLEIAKKLAGRETKIQLELGGKNPLVVLADADIAKAVDAAIIGGYSCSGQWCTSTSRVIVETGIYDAFLRTLTERARAIVVGDGGDEKVQMGPVCGKRQYETILDFIETGLREGARLVTGGKALTAGQYAKGWFIEPTIFADVSPGQVIAKEEIFGPVLVVIRADDLSDAIRLANDTRYGLSSSIYTGDLAKAQRFVAESEVGLCHVNMHTAYKEPQLEFGGVKESGRGDPEAGDSGVEFFTRHKVVYVRDRP
jgi:acyl-CoA reductase-like NAD-dependent aldehyde dehydrogenase